MRVFLDASVILAACGRNTGASRRIFDIHKHEGWALMASGYVMGEVALTFADVLLTLDKRDFGPLMGAGFYGLEIMKPGDFLKRNQQR